MTDKKTRIASFIASVECKEVDSNVILLGGASNQPDDINTTTNDGDCINGSYDGCNKSTNRGSCLNATAMCNSSKNGNKCNNLYEPNSLCMCTTAGGIITG